MLLLITEADALARIERALGFEEARIAGFLAISYVLGQILNSVGSLILDPLYDVFYDPDHGVFTYEKDANSPKRWTRILRRVGSWKSPLLSWVSRMVEANTARRRDNIWAALATEGGDAYTQGVFQRVRAYLQLSVPRAFDEIERLEAEQKFLRTATIASLVIAVVARWNAQPEPVVLAASIGAVFLFTRYVGRRRKTVERAYLYFGLRHLVPKTEVASASHAAQ